MLSSVSNFSYIVDSVVNGYMYFRSVQTGKKFTSCDFWLTFWWFWHSE